MSLQSLPHDAVLIVGSYLTPKTRLEGLGSISKCMQQQLGPLFTGSLALQVFSIGIFRAVLARFPNAISLQSTGRGKLGEREAQIVAEALGGGRLLQHLTTVDLSGHELRDGGLVPLLHALGKSPHLAKLSIAGNRPRPASIHAIFRSRAPIRALDLSRSRLEAAEIQALKAGCSALVELKLSGCSLTSKKQSGFNAFLTLVPELRGLQKLDISSNGINDRQFESFCAALLVSAESLPLVGLSIAEVRSCNTELDYHSLLTFVLLIACRTSYPPYARLLQSCCRCRNRFARSG
jgi:hypothetical protein